VCADQRCLLEEEEEEQLRRPSLNGNGRPCPRARRGRSIALLVLLALSPYPQARDAEEIIGSLCISCHGTDGNAVVPTFPKLAGLDAKYLEKQLLDYAAGKRRHQSMEAFAKGLTRDEIRSLAQHFSEQDRHDGIVTDPGLLETGQRLYHKGNREAGVPACAGCHRPDGSGTPRSPMLAGQNAPYVEEQLLRFKNDQRTNDRGQLMRTVAARLTTDEIKAVAQYLASLR